ncbi:MAG: hypothetical protein V7606_4397 [Burkholderiales bacterium]
MQTRAAFFYLARISCQCQGAAFDQCGDPTNPPGSPCSDMKSALSSAEHHLLGQHALGRFEHIDEAK